jgi:hypothetical protein
MPVWTRATSWWELPVAHAFATYTFAELLGFRETDLLVTVEPESTPTAMISRGLGPCPKPSR